MTQSAQSAGKAEELWEKYRKIHAPETGLSKIAFMEALSEYAKLYGEMVRREDAGVCKEIAENHWPGLDAGASDKCAAAISNKELPELP